MYREREEREGQQVKKEELFGECHPEREREREGERVVS
jgi:hypothetical protein